MTFEEELIEQVNNLQKCMSEQREEHREQIRDLKGSLYSANQRIVGFKKRIAELKNTRTQWISEELSPALNKCFRCKISCDGVLIVAVDDYNELVEVVNKAAGKAGEQ